MNGFNGGGGARTVGTGFLGQITPDVGARGTEGRILTAHLHRKGQTWPLSPGEVSGVFDTQ